MKSYDMSRLLLLLFLCGSDSVHGDCLLKRQASVECADLEDARYIDTYQLHTLRASSSGETLAPGNFINLTSLRYLDLSNGNIETIKTGSFANLRSLMTLHLENNHITHLEAGAFNGMKHLRNLHLSGNKIKRLPSALMGLKELKYLDVSDNPLNCNCVSMKLRDSLLARGVKISKKTRCLEPVSSKGLSLLKPDTKMTCVFETQDLEMQGDQPSEDRIDATGDEEFGQIADDDLAGEEKELEQPAEITEEETPSPLSQSEDPSTQIEMLSSSTSSAGLSTDGLTLFSSTSSNGYSSDTEMSSLPTSSQGSFIEAETSSPSTLSESSSTVTILTTLAEATPVEISSSTIETSSEKDEEVDLDAAVVEKKESSTPDLFTQYITEGSGETDDEGSGEPDDEGSGLDVIPKIISPVNVDEINFNDTLENADDSSSVVPITSITPTTTDAGWWGVWDVLNPFGSSSDSITTSAPLTTEKNPEQQVEEEQFIPSATELAKDAEESPIVPKIAVQDESLRNSVEPPTGDNPPAGDAVVGAADSAPSQEPQKGTGSYYVLATLLAILAILIAFAAYKGDFCKKKRKRGDVERGTEMKDMQKSLLEQNAVQPKVQVSNGNTMENVPLMNSTSTPEEPKENQRSYDISPAPATTNGANKSGGWTTDVIDPVKPPRKGYGQEIEAPLNGLNPPMDDIDGPTTVNSGSDDALANGDYNGEVPPLSPGAQRVKITMGELPESVPKTPILITRLKNGDNLVKTP
ncbi:uncharacterized protein LOC131666062 [Phymastichus coffea]|uniref:uncharacterized protein LOC131666062 n=1 Tax=Phymastichus coffea TaxID=108790 RepID=UPI00273C8268|nr:uncharacterized protein LOC131666062 [Phymastichus coffea]